MPIPRESYAHALAPPTSPPPSELQAQQPPRTWSVEFVRASTFTLFRYGEEIWRERGVRTRQYFYSTPLRGAQGAKPSPRDSCSRCPNLATGMDPGSILRGCSERTGRGRTAMRTRACAFGTSSEQPVLLLYSATGRKYGVGLEFVRARTFTLFRYGEEIWRERGVRTRPYVYSIPLRGGNMA